jgi:hypothetical protein
MRKMTEGLEKHVFSCADVTTHGWRGFAAVPTWLCMLCMCDIYLAFSKNLIL